MTIIGTYSKFDDQPRAPLVFPLHQIPDLSCELPLLRITDQPGLSSVDRIVHLELYAGVSFDVLNPVRFFIHLRDDVVLSVRLDEPDFNLVLST